MKVVKPRKCKECGSVFTPKYSTVQSCCSVSCSIAYSKTIKDNKEAKEWSIEKKERKEALMTHPEWLKLLQVTFNTFIRIRDAKEPCISCDTNKTNIKYDAGHFFSVGGFPSVRFDEDNVHKQCSNNCNVHLSANIHEYQPRLIKKIGLERFEALEYRARNTSLKISIPEIQEKIKEYKEKIKQLKNKNL